ncbi:DNA polymerase-3 subunit delta' [Actinopolymorpha singaporensis]|uniref:DNA polymerase-3 subunit delta n=2 Tax=Actinopolymorpha singaporensis TaxID=117157 RepID=A0A1H1Q394_9ACTN|nr:DNA polymerase III subunit delta' [Actinopolymorpha singaporensis]SDS17991.1 DNA polymerase-3 subunit delta' [Actinopolymorpha singaporensis]
MTQVRQADSDAGQRSPADVPMTGVWADLVGQEPTVAVLRPAATGAAAWLAGDRSRSAMTHAWLLTGPPGSGRSNAARAFAAALQCERGGCGECSACRTALTGSHPDVTLVRTEQLSLRVDEIRELVRKSAMSPVGRRWQILVVEDADRLTEQAADALLKSLEEPAERTVWLLCAPTVEDVVPTIRSRCRLLVLRTPPTSAVAEVLQRRYDVDPGVAAFAARASQGHIGRARALATQEDVRARRQQVLAVPSNLRDLASCLTAAAQLVELAATEAKEATADLDGAEKLELERAYGVSGSGGRGARPRQLQTAQKDLEEQQKVRAKRLQRDALDRALLDLTAYYRDVLALALGARTELVNEELREDIERRAAATRPEQVIRQIDAILACREAITANVAPLLAAESMTIALWNTPG